jgi:CheY-like chemotaxis protein
MAHWLLFLRVSIIFWQNEGPMTVLYVDDDPEDIEIFCSVLAEIGPQHICLIANGALEALDRLHSMETLPSVVILDINMQLVDGLDGLQKIREIKRLANIPAIMVSAATHARLLDKVESLGAIYMEKPAGFLAYVEQLRNKFKELGF